MPREDLIPTLKTVERSGKQHQQIYWIAAKDLKEAAKRSPEEAVKMAGGNPDRVLMLFHGWVESPATLEAAQLRGAASALAFQGDLSAKEEERGDLHDNVAHRMTESFTVEAFQAGAWKEDVAEYNRSEIDPAFEKGWDNKAVQADVVAMAAASQSMYDTDTVKVYRGIKGEQAQVILDARSAGKEIEVDVGVTTSFSENYLVARSFALPSMAPRSGESVAGVVLEMEIPRSSIIGSHRLGLGKHFGDSTAPIFNKREAEVLVLTKGSMKVSASSVRVPLRDIAAEPEWAKPPKPKVY